MWESFLVMRVCVRSMITTAPSRSSVPLPAIPASLALLWQLSSPPPPATLSSEAGRGGGGSSGERSSGDGRGIGETNTGK